MQHPSKHSEQEILQIQEINATKKTVRNSVGTECIDKKVFNEPTVSSPTDVMEVTAFFSLSNAQVGSGFLL